MGKDTVLLFFGDKTIHENESDLGQFLYPQFPKRTAVIVHFVCFVVVVFCLDQIGRAHV